MTKIIYFARTKGSKDKKKRKRRRDALTVGALAGGSTALAGNSLKYNSKLKETLNDLASREKTFWESLQRADDNYKKIKEGKERLKELKKIIKDARETKNFYNSPDAPINETLRKQQARFLDESRTIRSLQQDNIRLFKGNKELFDQPLKNLDRFRFLRKSSGVASGVLAAGAIGYGLKDKLRRPRKKDG